MPTRATRRLLASSFTLIFAGLAITGCKSAFVEAVVRNETAQPVSLIEVDYPSASFGRALLAPHAEFHYRFKILGSGATRVQWTDSQRKEHTVSGPELHEGKQGRLAIAIGETTALWDAQLQ